MTGQNGEMLAIGTAGWALPKEWKDSFSDEGSHLSRYAQRLNAVEINSSFYREHLPRTYERWAAEVPAHFQFSVKLNQAFTHKCELKPKEKDLRLSLEGIQHLGEKLGVILLQFPGKMDFHAQRMERFFTLIRKHYEGPLVLEARNCSWISSEAKELFYDHEITKVIADPERCPGGPKKIFTSSGLAYYRLHGSPVIYRSSYSKAYLSRLKKELAQYKNVWVIFDNTTFGHATENALWLMKK